MPVILQVGLDVSGELLNDDGDSVCPLIGFDNQADIVSISSTTAEDDFPVENLKNPATHLRWIGTDTNVIEQITITNLTEESDYIAIAGHNFGDDSGNCDIRIEGITAVSPTDTVNLIGAGGSPGTFVTVADNSPLIIRFTHGFYIGFNIYLGVTGTPPQAAVIYIGSLTVLERGVKVDVTHTPVPVAHRTRVVNGMSETGNFLGRIVLSDHYETKAEFFGFTDDFFRNVMWDFLDAAQSDPFFFAWAPDDYPNDTGYMWLIDDAVPEQSPDPTRIWALTLQMAGITSND